MRRGFDTEFPDLFEQVQRHAKAADRVAVATELIKAKDFRASTCLVVLESNHKMLRCLFALASEANYRRDLKIRCEKWLRPPNVKETHEFQVRAKLDGTCSWILVNNTFLDWKASPATDPGDRLLCISGIPGCGKSVLASSLVQAFDCECTTPIMFFFSSIDTTRQTINHLIRSMIWQLTEQSSDDKHINDLHETMTKGQPTTLDLLNILHHLIASSSSKICCIVDGIDECSGSGDAILALVRDLLTKHSHFKVILLGQPLAFPSKAQLQDFRARLIEIQPSDVQKDIEKLIRTEIDSCKLTRLPVVHDKILDALQTNSDGMFLWAKLMLEELRKSSTTLEVLERLRSLPRGLEKAYTLVLDKLVARLDTHELKLAQNVVTFATVARRPLQVLEMAYIHAMNLKLDASDGGKAFDQYLLLDPTETILRVCGSLVSISDDQIRLVHPSLRRFLVRGLEDVDPSRAPNCPLQFRINMHDAHSRVSLACFQYMSSGPYGFPIQEPDKTAVIRSQHPLVEYASYNAIYHWKLSGATGSSLGDAVKKVAQSSAIVSWAEHIAIGWVENGYDTSSGDIYEDILRGDIAPELGPVLRSRLQEEISLTINQFGPNHERVEYLHFALTALTGFLDMFSVTGSSLSSDNSKSEGESNDRNKVTRGSVHQIRAPHSGALIDRPSFPFQEPSAVIASAVQSLNTHRFLPHGQTYAMVAILKHGQVLRKGTDPLRMLFQAILQKAMALPVFAVLCIAGYYEGFKKFQEALDLSKIALSRVQDKVGVGANIAHSLLGRCYHELGDLHSSFQHLYQALNCKETRWARYTRNSLYNTYHKSGKSTEAVAFFQDLLAKDQKRYGKDDLRTFATEHFVSYALNSAEQHNAAITVLENIATRWKVSFWDKVWFESDRLQLDFLHELDWLCDCPISEELLHRLLKLIEGLRMETNLLNMKVRQRIGEVKFDNQADEEARTWFAEVAELLRKTKREDKEYKEILSRNKLWLGKVVLQMDGAAFAIPHLKDALDGFKSTNGVRYADTAETLEWLVIAYRDLDRYDLMLELAKELASIDEALFGAYSRFTRRSRRYVRTALAKMGNAESPDADGEDTDSEDVDSEDADSDETSNENAGEMV